MASLEETKKLAEEIGWSLEEMYVYNIAQATPQLELIAEELRKSGQLKLADDLDQFVTDAGFDGWSAAQLQPAVGPETARLQQIVQPSNQSRTYIFNEVLGYVKNPELKQSLLDLIDSLPPIGLSYITKPPEPSI